MPSARTKNETRQRVDVLDRTLKAGRAVVEEGRQPWQETNGHAGARQRQLAHRSRRVQAAQPISAARTKTAV